LTGVRVMWTLFKRRIQPLKARARPLFQYSGPADPMCESLEELEPSEVRARVCAVIKKRLTAEEEADLNLHLAGQAHLPMARREGHDPRCVSLSFFPC
ncbi:hypothetical protein BAE44_0001237, partial [Dichanthelium oligosanthes]